MTLEKTLSANESPGERILIFRLWLRCNSKYVSHIGTLLEAKKVLSNIYFGFKCPYESSIGDSLKISKLVTCG
jgi:hypothetical protein